jgi:hypothetical protein
LPGIISHTLSLGASYRLTDDITASLAWVHGFRNDIEGGLREQPVATAKIDSQYDSIVAGLNIQYGGRRMRASEVGRSGGPE